MPFPYCLLFGDIKKLIIEAVAMPFISCENMALNYFTANWTLFKKSLYLPNYVRKFYFKFFSVWFNQLKNKLLVNYLRSSGNELTTVRISPFYVAMLSNNSFICKYDIFFRKYELWRQFYKIDWKNRKCKKLPASYSTEDIAHLLQSHFLKSPFFFLQPLAL